MSCEKKCVYLAGGFYSNWQGKIKSQILDYDFLDPRDHKLVSAENYTEWDLKAIKESDVLLAYIEMDNPGGYALALEIGYAKALKKKIILVEEHKTETRRKYFDMVRQVADVNFESLDDAIEYLKNLESKDKNLTLNFE